MLEIVLRRLNQGSLERLLNFLSSDITMLTQRIKLRNFALKSEQNCALVSVYLERCSPINLEFCEFNIALGRYGKPEEHEMLPLRAVQTPDTWFESGERLRTDQPEQSNQAEATYPCVPTPELSPTSEQTTGTMKSVLVLAFYTLIVRTDCVEQGKIDQGPTGSQGWSPAGELSDSRYLPMGRETQAQLVWEEGVTDGGRTGRMLSFLIHLLDIHASFS
ncbi:unnamed protein product [Echinostoma caproni]|uniref:Uncharacterized protein n=1 Tax=Echinostoma caproni TaxID=27848 RepID=A0A183ARI8_9TREM|nr:unnamed protein product [Echinostoma caproni]